MAIPIANPISHGTGVDPAGDPIMIVTRNAGVVIYSVKANEADLANFVKDKVHPFLRQETTSQQANFYTVRVSDDALLLVCLIDAYNASWNGVSADVTDYLNTEAIKVTAHGNDPDNWTFLR